MTLCYITDRRTLCGPLPVRIAAVADAGADWIQIREKDLAPRELLRLAREARRLVPRGGARLLVNERADVAFAAGLDGVHLPSSAPPPEEIRSGAADALPLDFLIGVSCHRLAEARRAEAEGADYVLFGPVFDTPSKRSYGPPLGAAQLGEVCRAVSLPVLALGGVTLANAAHCRDAGAAGVAGIGLFQRASDIGALVTALKRVWTPR